MIAAVLLTVACNRSGTRRVSVVYPEHWLVGQHRNCVVDGIRDVVNGLAELDCDTEASETPRNRIFVMDVEFSGHFSEKDNPWTCEKNKESLVCKN